MNASSTLRAFTQRFYSVILIIHYGYIEYTNNAKLVTVQVLFFYAK